MKSLFILSILVSVSVNAYSAEVGEDKKGECAFSNQSNKREAKVVEVPASQEVKKEESKVKSK